jgi:hypothetical protein
MAWSTHRGIGDTLAHLLSGSRAALGDNLFGMYVFGSLTSGDFDEQTSDIDFAVVTRDAVASRTQAELGELNTRIQASGSPWAAKLEGSFLPLQVFKDFNPERVPYPTIGMGGWYGLDHKGIERAIQRSLLREHGIALAGPEPNTFIDPVSPDELRMETRDLVHGWWKQQLDDPTRIRRRGYQAYAVLTMCRALYTLETGCIASKPTAAGWAQRWLPGRWCGLIDRALSWRSDDGVDDLAVTLELIRYVVDRER